MVFGVGFFWFGVLRFLFFTSGFCGVRGSKKTFLILPFFPSCIIIQYLMVLSRIKKN